MANINFFARDCRINIFSFLQRSSLLQCRLVSKQWKNDASVNYLWAKFLDENNISTGSLPLGNECIEFLIRTYTWRMLNGPTPLGMELHAIISIKKVLRVVESNGVFYFIMKKNICKYSLAASSCVTLDFSDSVIKSFKKIDVKKVNFSLNRNGNLVFFHKKKIFECIEKQKSLDVEEVYEHPTVINDIAVSPVDDSYLVSSKKKKKFELTLLSKTAQNTWSISVCGSQWEYIEDFKLGTEYFYVVFYKFINLVDSARGADLLTTRTCEIFKIADLSFVSTFNFSRGKKSNDKTQLTNIYYSDESILLINKGSTAYYSKSNTLPPKKWDFHQLISSVKDVEYSNQKLLLLGENEEKNYTFVCVNAASFVNDEKLKVKKISVPHASPLGVTYFQNHLFIFDENSLYKAEVYKAKASITSPSKESIPTSKSIND